MNRFNPLRNPPWQPDPLSGSTLSGASSPLLEPTDPLFDNDDEINIPRPTTALPPTLRQPALFSADTLPFPMGQNPSPSIQGMNHLLQEVRVGVQELRLVIEGQQQQVHQYQQQEGAQPANELFVGSPTPFGPVEQEARPQEAFVQHSLAALTVATPLHASVPSAVSLVSSTPRPRVNSMFRRPYQASPPPQGLIDPNVTEHQEQLEPKRQRVNRTLEFENVVASQPALYPPAAPAVMPNYSISNTGMQQQQQHGGTGAPGAAESLPPLPPVDLPTPEELARTRAQLEYELQRHFIGIMSHNKQQRSMLPTPQSKKLHENWLKAMMRRKECLTQRVATLLQNELGVSVQSAEYTRYCQQQGAGGVRVLAKRSRPVWEAQQARAEANRQAALQRRSERMKEAVVAFLAEQERKVINIAALLVK